MEFLKIVLLSVLAAVAYGVAHDQITARICVEYFTIGHPPLFHTDSPTLLGLGWGVAATWWVGLFLGVPLALTARCGNGIPVSARDLMGPIGGLLAVMATAALVSGLCGFALANAGIISLMPSMASLVPQASHARFLADWWTHLASYATALIGGVVLIVSTWRRRRKTEGGLEL